MRHPLAPLALLGSLLVAGCGGGGGGGGGSAPPETTVTLHSISGFDGVIGESLTTGARFVSTTSQVGAGDAAGASWRGYYRFDLSPIPAGATVTSAVLRTFQTDVHGTPYVTHGNLTLEHALLHPALDPGDFDGPAYAPPLGNLSTTATSGERTIDVREAVIQDLAAGRAGCDFRMSFPMASDGDSDEDLVFLVSAAASGGTGEVPTIVVTYH